MWRDSTAASERTLEVGWKIPGQRAWSLDVKRVGKTVSMRWSSTQSLGKFRRAADATRSPTLAGQPANIPSCCIRVIICLAAKSISTQLIHFLKLYRKVSKINLLLDSPLQSKVKYHVRGLHHSRFWLPLSMDSCDELHRLCRRHNKTG